MEIVLLSSDKRTISIDVIIIIIIIMKRKLVEHYERCHGGRTCSPRSVILLLRKAMTGLFCDRKVRATSF